MLCMLCHAMHPPSEEDLKKDGIVSLQCFMLFCLLWFLLCMLGHAVLVKASKACRQKDEVNLQVCCCFACFGPCLALRCPCFGLLWFKGQQSRSAWSNPELLLATCVLCTCRTCGMRWCQCMRTARTWLSH